MVFISILIPTKDYTEGLIRLLEYLPKNKRYLKIIISDDSSNDKIQNHIKKIKLCNLIYSKNVKNLGVANNWNKLLKESNSKYFMFIHHDDYISDSFFFHKLFKLIKNNKNKDIISIDTKIIYPDTKKKNHIHYLLRYFLNLISKKYILKRNYLGPASSLIIKNTNIPLFDNKLQWFIDVDFYYRILLDKQIIFTNKLIINSESNHSFSITYSIKDKIKKISCMEQSYLIKKYKFTNLNKFLFFLEPILWLLIRTLNLILKR